MGGAQIDTVLESMQLHIDTLKIDKQKLEIENKALRENLKHYEDQAVGMPKSLTSFEDMQKYHKQKYEDKS